MNRALVRCGLVAALFLAGCGVGSSSSPGVSPQATSNAPATRGGCDDIAEAQRLLAGRDTEDATEPRSRDRDAALELLIGLEDKDHAVEAEGLDDNGDFLRVALAAGAAQNGAVGLDTVLNALNRAAVVCQRLPEESASPATTTDPPAKPSATTTTTAPVSTSDVALSQTGVGFAPFGTSVENVGQQGEATFGRKADRDATIPCSYGGPDVRELQWGALYLYFEKTTTGDWPLVGWLVDPAMATPGEPTNPLTSEAIGPGSTASDIVDAYGDTAALPTEDDLLLGSPLASFGEGDPPMLGLMTGLGPEDTILVMAFGVPCSEDGIDFAVSGAPSD